MTAVQKPKSVAATRLKPGTGGPDHRLDRRRNRRHGSRDGTPRLRRRGPSLARAGRPHGDDFPRTGSAPAQATGCRAGHHPPRLADTRPRPICGRYLAVAGPCPGPCAGPRARPRPCSQHAELRLMTTFQAMGTSVWVDGGSADRVAAWFEQVEDVCSRFRPDSELSHLNASSPGWSAISPLLHTVLAAADGRAR